MTKKDLIEWLEQPESITENWDGEIYNLLIGVDYPKAKDYYGSGESVTESTDMALVLLNEVVTPLRILNLTDDGLACGATLTVFPNGLHEPGIKVAAWHENFAMVICLVVLKALDMMEEGE